MTNQEVIPGVQIVENFFQYPLAVRQHALLSEFYDWRAPDGEVYKRVSLLRVPGMVAKLQEIVGPLTLLGTAYRLNYEGEIPNQSIHSDIGWGTHAAVAYLQEGESGTAFWKHKRTGAVSIQPGDTELFQEIGDDWEDPEAWELRHVVEMKFNRGLVYDSTLFHSRWPFEAFGSSSKDGRLIAVAFFSPEKVDDTTIEA